MPRSVLAGAAMKLWRFFRSIKVAIVLILILAGLCLIGALILQVPAGLSKHSLEYSQWLEYVAHPEYGPWAETMDFLQLFDVFHSIPFIVIGILLVVNISVCSIQRWRTTWASIFRVGHIQRHEEFYEADSKDSIKLHTAEIDLDRIRSSTVATFRRRGYQTRTVAMTDKLYIWAVKNRLSPFGTYLVHLGLILFITGFLVTSYFGFSDSSLIVVEHTERSVGHGTSLSLRLESFGDEYWPDGTPKDYRSDIILYKDGTLVERGTIRVNQPLRFQGLRFYQSFFGPAAMVHIETASGIQVYDSGIALCDTLETVPYQRPAGWLVLDNQHLIVHAIGPAANTPDPFIGEDEIGLELYDDATVQPIGWTKLKKGEPVELRDLQLTYLGSAMYSGFQVSKDPGGGFIWMASVLFLAGISVVFFLPRRQLWAMVYAVEEGSRVLVRTALSRSPGANSEFERIAAELGDALDYDENSNGRRGQ